MSYRCILGCPQAKRSKVVHRFPNPMKYPKQFESWLRLVPNDFDKENFDYSKYRACDRHFEENYRYTWNRPINRLAIPKLHLPGQIGTHFTSADSFSIDLPSSSYPMLSEGAECVIKYPIEVDVASSTWGRLVHDVSIPYSGEVYYASDCIGETSQLHSPGQVCIVQSFDGTKELEEEVNHELLGLLSKKKYPLLLVSCD